MFSLFKSLHLYAISRSAGVFILAVTASLLSANVVYAQNSAEKKQTDQGPDSLQSKFEIGITGGLSLNQFTKAQPQTGFSTGYSSGLMVHYKIYKGLGLQVEANFLQQGGQLIRFKDDTRIGLEESFETRNVKNSSYDLNSMEVPLLLNYTFQFKQTWKPSFYLGGSYAYTFEVMESYQKTGDLLPGEDIIATVHGTQNSSSRFESNRFNFIAGANVRLPLGPRLMLLLDFRYLTGLSPAIQGYSYIEKEPLGADLRSNSFITKAGIAFSL